MSSRIGLSLNQDKSKKMTWPLSSNNSKLGIEQYSKKDSAQRKLVGNRGTGIFYLKESEVSTNLFTGKTAEVIIQRGTKRIKRHLNSQNSSISNKSPKHVCDTCQSEIGKEISRLIIMRDKDGGPSVLCFHFFFPCWDLALLCQKYPHLIIDRLRFSLPENMQMKKSSLEDLQSSLDFWD